MNFQIFRHWFHSNPRSVDTWNLPGRPVFAAQPKAAWVHANGCWALYRLLGRYAP